jgi:glycosyltransferase involved in cell wall biosynthesis
MALADQDMLAGYLTGVPAHRDAIPIWLRRLLKSYLDNYEIPIDSRLVHHNFIAPLTVKLAERLATKTTAGVWGRRADAWFDRWAARQVARQRADLVVGYENGALELFRTAKSLGIRTVLDAASFHHRWQDKFCTPAESAAAHKKMVARKNAEIALADQILTVSDYARESYIDGGVAEERVQACPVGVDSRAFNASERTAAVAESDPIRFVFVGHGGHVKGADVLREAALQLASQGVEFRLCMIGKHLSEHQFEKLPFATCLDWMPQSRLADELTRHDVLILPSRFDSFGMVVAEAMASGLPVIVSDHVGAKEMVDEGKNGRIVPAGDAAALANAMRWFRDHRGHIKEMSCAARDAAVRYDWQQYRQRVVHFFQSFTAEC